MLVAVVVIELKASPDLLIDCFLYEGNTGNGLTTYLLDGYSLTLTQENLEYTRKLKLLTFILKT